jgi:serine/threonine-protein phosphatase 6 catalytic subunit
VFGSRVTNDFCVINDLTLIARAHQLVQEGYQFWFKGRNLVTVWSAPNYCYRCNNLASIMQVRENCETEFKTFKTVPESAKSVHFKNVLPYFL